MSTQWYDIVIAGAGAAGSGCAIAAARAGAKVLLVEKGPGPGGTVREALLHTLGGIFDDEGQPLNAGLPVELTERLTRACAATRVRRMGRTWVLNVDPEVYGRAVEEWLGETSGLDVWYGSQAGEVTVEGDRVRGVKIDTGDRLIRVSAGAIVDATGSARLVRSIEPGLVEDGEALGGFIVSIRGLEVGSLQFPRGVAILREVRQAVEQQVLPAECATVWLDSGVREDEAYAKFSVEAESVDDGRMRMAADRLLELLRGMPGFANGFIERYGKPGVRDGGRIRGVYCLTEDDIRSGARFDDTACRACWPIEHWHPQLGVRLEYLPPGHRYELPLRSMRVDGFANLWAVGKCLSAEPRAQASARVAGTCWAMGEAVGREIAGKG